MQRFASARAQTAARPRTSWRYSCSACCWSCACRCAKWPHGSNTSARTWSASTRACAHGAQGRVPHAGDAPGPFPVAVRSRAMLLLDLPVELLVVIATQVAEDEELAAALTCSGLRHCRQHGQGRGRRHHCRRTTVLLTRIGSAFCSAGKLEWAVSSCWLPLSGSLLLCAARAGQLEQLSWLRARGFAWEPCKGDGDYQWSSAASSRAAVGGRGWLRLGRAQSSALKPL
jgi:hypothetical protein